MQDKKQKVDRNLLSVVALFGAITLVIVMFYGAIILGGIGGTEHVEVTACVVEKVKGNPTYLGAAGLTTKLKCALMKDVSPTLLDMYAQGWRIVGLVERQGKSARAAFPPSPLYYMERVTKDKWLEF